MKLQLCPVCPIEIAPDFRVQHHHTTTEMGSFKPAALDLQAQEGDRDAKAFRQFLKRPTELGVMGFCLLVHNGTYLIGIVCGMAEEAWDAPRTIQAYGSDHGIVKFHNFNMGGKFCRSMEQPQLHEPHSRRLLGDLAAPRDR